MEYGSVYFLGIGGIGMSALARYFLIGGKAVGGYDRTRTALTESLSAAGAVIHYEDDPDLIGKDFRDPDSTLIIYTPALPADHKELGWFRSRGFEVIKRSEALGHLAEGKYVMAVAGTHGKTTTATMVAWLNEAAGGGGSAFLGGISKNFDSNLIYGQGDRFAVEADEFDRSFLRLYPDVAVITSADADHLDIYGSHDSLLDSFGEFVSQTKEGGALILKKGVTVPLKNKGINIYTYALEEDADFKAVNLSVLSDGTYRFDMACPDTVIEGCRLGVPGRINVENAVAAVAMLWFAARRGGEPEKFDHIKIRGALDTFRGVRRRFDFHINTPELIYMDDYAHHPEELRAAIASVKEMFPGRRLTVIFQPHLYSRTRDFYREFAASLSLADEVLLVPIYPAREEPLEGVSSEMIARLITVPNRSVELDEIAIQARAANPEVLITFGAGDIENYCAEIAESLAGSRGKNRR